MSSSIGQHLQLSSKKKKEESLLLLEAACQKNRSFILAHPQYQLNEDEEKLLKQYQNKLKAGWPLAYIIGYKDFYQSAFLVSPSVLIPRPETELIVDLGLSFAKDNIKKKINFLDIGTGSGAIIVSLAKVIKESSSYNNALFFASDISLSALEIAKENASRQNLLKKINFYKSNLLSSLPAKIFDRPVFIAANLPYLKKEEFSREKSIRMEPKLALISDEDGLKHYHRLLKQLKTKAKDTSFRLLMEINPRQRVKLTKMAQANFPQAKIKKEPDLSGRTRFIILDNNI